MLCTLLAEAGPFSATLWAQPVGSFRVALPACLYKGGPRVAQDALEHSKQGRAQADPRCAGACRASMPVMTVAMAYFIESQVPTSSVVASLVVLSTGVAICVWQGQASGTLVSIILCTLSTLVRRARALAAHG